jgi:hypothetical protein
MARLDSPPPVNKVPDDGLPWIEHTKTGGRTYMWRNRMGYHYEAQFPESDLDVAEMYRDDWESHGVLLGAFPELGDIYAANGEPITTRTYTVGEHGKWVKMSERHTA